MTASSSESNPHSVSGPVFTLNKSPHSSITEDEKREFDSILHSHKQLNLFWKNKTETDSIKSWDKFYLRNENRFFKDRQYLKNEFSDIFAQITDESPSPDSHTQSKTPLRFIEIGCGVGNALFPIALSNSKLQIHGCDCSKNAIQQLKNDEIYKQNEHRMRVWIQDITQPFEDKFNNSFGFATLIFVLSALSMSEVENCLRNVRQIMLKGGKLFIRDYAQYDLSELRYSNTNKLSEHYYVRQDGTRALYFDIDELCSLMIKCGFEITESFYVEKEVVNRKKDLSMKRRFIQITAQKT